MKLVDELTQPRSKLHAKHVAGYVASHPEQFDELIDIYLGVEGRMTQNAAYILMYAADYRPEWIAPYIPQLIDNLSQYPVVAIRRNTVRILQDQKIPEDYQGVLYELCFNYLLSSQEPIAVKAFSMTILANMAHLYPELAHELKSVISQLVSEGSAGIKSRGKKVLQQLDRLGT